MKINKKDKEMKRVLLYSFVAAATLVVASCNEDYKDWANPLTNSPEDVNGTLSTKIAASSADIKRESYADDASVKLIDYVSTENATEVAGVRFNSLKVNGAFDVPFVQTNNSVSVNINQLDSVVRLAYNSLAYVKRNLEITTEVGVDLANGESIVTQCNAVTVGYTPADVIPACHKEAQSGYYYIGGYNGWNLASPTPMSPNGDGTYSVTITVGDGEWFSFAPQSAVDTQDWNILYRAEKNGSTAMSGFIGLEPASGNSWQVETGGKYCFTLDPVNYTYSISEVHENLFMTGSNYNWGGTWLPMTPCYGSDSDYWTVIYLHEGEQFKFAPQADWGGDFGGEAAVNDAAGANITVDGTNLVAGKAGWYLLHVVNGSERKLNVYKPEVYLIGSVAPVNDWSISADNIFTIPSDENGEFVSPAFSSDGEIRMCVKFEGFDWWMTEFVAFDGKIEYRGRGGDQARVNVSAGKKAYINFAKGTCEFK